VDALARGEPTVRIDVLTSLSSVVARHHNLHANRYALVQIDHIVIEHSDAS
jgi:hypothetical protein